MLRNVIRGSLKPEFQSSVGKLFKFSRCLLSSTSPPEVLTAKQQSDNNQASAIQADFDSTFPHIVKNLLHEDDHRLQAVLEHYKKVLEYNVPFGKKIRGLSTVYAYKILTSSSVASRENMYLAHLLGWCLEIEGVGLGAINDALLMEQGIFKLLKKYCKSEPYYINIVELFHEVTSKTLFGQCLDMLCAGSGKSSNIEKFTMENYSAIVEYKTAYYSCYLPVALAMYMAGMKDPNSHAQAKDLLLQMGHLFQVQNDFLDCFGSFKQTGKTGNDIQEGKCTWLVVKALERSNDMQRTIIEENYGKSDDQSVSNVKKLYVDLNLPLVFAKYEEETYDRLISILNAPTFKLPQNIFQHFLSQMCKRKS